MEPQTIGPLLSFWECHEDQLKTLYPGLTWERLSLEMQTFCSRGDGDMNTFLEKAQKGIPLEYITSRAYFYKSEFLVTPDVFIPRSESEILIEKAVQICQRKLETENTLLLKVADVGTGSGAMILSLALDLNFPIVGMAIDICEKALQIARKNYLLLKSQLCPETSIRFLEGDRLHPVGEKLHLILSNPPYIKEEAGRVGVHSQVLEFEPHKALFLKDREYIFWYQEFFDQAYNCLYSRGELVMEGHEDCLLELSLLAEKRGFENIEIHQDYTERERFLTMKRP